MVARLSCDNTWIVSGFGGAAFCSPSLQFVHSARRLERASSPPFDLSRMCPIVRRIVREVLNGSGSPAATPQTWHVWPLRSNIQALVSVFFIISNRRSNLIESARAFQIIFPQDR